MSPRKFIEVGLFALFFSACAHGQTGQNRGVGQRLDQLEAEEAKRQQRLTGLEQELDRTQVAIVEAKSELNEHQCRAKNALVRAEVISFRSKCVQQQATYEACHAAKESATAQGCAAGLFVALLTMGAAGPATIAACAGGALIGKNSTGRCGVPPDCTARFDNIDKKMAIKHRPEQIPNCTLDLSINRTYAGKPGPGKRMTREEQRRIRQQQLRRRSRPAPRAWK